MYQEFMWLCDAARIAADGYETTEPTTTKVKPKRNRQ